MLNITFKKYHMKKKKPVTRAGYLSKNPMGFACPWESDEGAAAEADVRRSFLLPGEDRGRVPKEEAGNSAGRSFLPQTRWAASEAEPPLTWSDGAARRRDRWWPATAPPQRMVATAAICVYREDVSVRML